jgi:hypothetical protein
MLKPTPAQPNSNGWAPFDMPHHELAACCLRMQHKLHKFSIPCTHQKHEVFVLEEFSETIYYIDLMEHIIFMTHRCKSALYTYIILVEEQCSFLAAHLMMFGKEVPIMDSKEMSMMKHPPTPQ